MVLIIFLIASVILFIIGISIISLKKDRAIGGISLAGSLIYLILFILILNLNFEIDKINSQANNKTSGSNVSVSGDVVAIKPSSVTSSRYEDVPVTPVQKVPIQEVKVIPVAAVNITPVNIATNTVATDEKQYVDANGKGLIKGNTSKTTGEKIYHIPGGFYYDVTKIDEVEKWFKTTKEAKDAGYRASQR